MTSIFPKITKSRPFPGQAGNGSYTKLRMICISGSVDIVFMRAGERRLSTENIHASGGYIMNVDQNHH